MGFERRPGLLVEGKGSPAAAAGCLCPRLEAWAVGPLLASQTDCLSRERSGEQLPSSTSKGPKAGPLLPSAVWLLQSRLWKEANLRVQFGAICVPCARPWMRSGRREGDGAGCAHGWQDPQRIVSGPCLDVRFNWRAMDRMPRLRRAQGRMQEGGRGLGETCRPSTAALCPPWATAQGGATKRQSHKVFSRAHTGQTSCFHMLSKLKKKTTKNQKQTQKPTTEAAPVYLNGDVTPSQLLISNKAGFNNLLRFN